MHVFTCLPFEQQLDILCWLSNNSEARGHVVACRAFCAPMSKPRAQNAHSQLRLKNPKHMNQKLPRHSKIQGYTHNKACISTYMYTNIYVFTRIISSQSSIVIKCNQPFTCRNYLR